MPQVTLHQQHHDEETSFNLSSRVRDTVGLSRSGRLRILEWGDNTVVYYVNNLND